MRTPYGVTGIWIDWFAGRESSVKEMASSKKTTKRGGALAALAGAAFLMWGAAPEIASAESARTGAGGADREISGERWVGDQWEIRGREVRRGPGWLVVEGVRARLPGFDSGGWELRADRLVGWIPRPGHLGAWWARGEVRVIGGTPVYAAGARAISFRPGRSIAVTGGERNAELLAETWNVRGRRIAVDLRRGAATMFEIGNR